MISTSHFASSSAMTAALAIAIYAGCGLVCTSIIRRGGKFEDRTKIPKDDFIGVLLFGVMTIIWPIIVAAFIAVCLFYAAESIARPPSPRKNESFHDDELQ